MIIRRLRVQNVGPFLDTHEVFFNEGLTSVVGSYDGAQERSNRSGKSFLAVDCPLYALFGEFRGRADDLTHRSADDEATVELEVESSQGVVFVIRRGRTASGKPIRELNGASIKEADLKEVVEREILGLSKEEYLLTNMFVQGKMHSFMEMGSADKRRVIAPWFKTDRWEPRRQLAAVRLKETITERDVLRRLIENNEAWIKYNPEVDLSPLTNALTSAKAKYAKAEKEYAQIKGKMEQVEEAGFELKRLRALEASAKDELLAFKSDIEAKIRNENANASYLREQISAARARSISIRDLEGRAESVLKAKEALAELRAELKTSVSDVERASTERDDLMRKFEDLKKSRTGICPVLKEACDRIERDKSLLDGIVNDGKAARERKDRGLERVKAIEFKIDMAEADLKMDLDGKRELERLKKMPTVPELEGKLQRVEMDVQKALSVEQDLKLGNLRPAVELKRARGKVVEAEERLDTLRKSLGELPDLDGLRRIYDAAQAELNAAVVKNNQRGEKRSEIDCAEEKIGTLDLDVERLSWCSYAFGPTGIPSREIENAFGVAEDSMNDVMTRLGTPLRLVFSPTRELKGWEDECACGARFDGGGRVCSQCGSKRRKKIKDEMRLEVMDAGHSSSFELDSGGGKVLISLGVRLGLSSLPGRDRVVKCQHLIIDEPDGALDDPSRAMLYGLLETKLPALGIRQVILITHHDVKEQFNQVVEVRRFESEGRSEVTKNA